MGTILVTGGSGMLGSYTAAQAADSGWETWATYSAHPVELPGCRTLQLDIRDSGKVNEAIARIKPDVVIHTAALVKPDPCEQHKGDAFATNVLGTHNVIAAAEDVGAHLIYISTDLVFSGERNPVRENDQLSPPNYYGLTKAAGEAAVHASRLNSAIVRTSVIYGPRKFSFLDSFSDKVIESLRAGQRFKAFVDQCRPAIPVWNLAEVLLEIANRRLTGIYHAVSPDVVSRHQFARRIAAVFGLDESLIEAVSMDDMEFIAHRPKMLVLDTLSTARTLNSRLLSFEDGVLQLRERMHK